MLRQNQTPLNQIPGTHLRHLKLLPDRIQAPNAQRGSVFLPVSPEPKVPAAIPQEHPQLAPTLRRQRFQQTPVQAPANVQQLPLAILQ